MTPRQGIAVGVLLGTMGGAGTVSLLQTQASALGAVTAGAVCIRSRPLPDGGLELSFAADGVAHVVSKDGGQHAVPLSTVGSFEAKDLVCARQLLEDVGASMAP
jgi:hypothetical protein